MSVDLSGRDVMAILGGSLIGAIGAAMLLVGWLAL
jgi:hypothetical protein